MSEIEVYPVERDTRILEKQKKLAVKTECESGSQDGFIDWANLYQEYYSEKVAFFT